MSVLASSVDFPRDVNPGEREVALEQLLGERARTMIRRVIAQRFRRGRIGVLGDDEREDLSAMAMLRVLQRLRSQSDPDGASIVNFDHYVATVTLHACDDLVRERLPRRTAAKNRLCYVLGHDTRFAQWTLDGEVVCGLAAWRGMRSIARTVAMNGVRHLAGDRDVRRFLRAIFFAAQQPVELDAVVNAAAELWEMIDLPSLMLDDVRHLSTASETKQIDDRQFLARLWQEIRLLNRPQRAALLLNLRDDRGSATELFPLLGVATIDEIAEVVEMPREEFAALWPDLPMPDGDVAAILGVTRQQVINLRKAARDRLRRRMRY